MCLCVFSSVHSRGRLFMQEISLAPFSQIPVNPSIASLILPLNTHTLTHIHTLPWQEVTPVAHDPSRPTGPSLLVYRCPGPQCVCVYVYVYMYNYPCDNQFVFVESEDTLVLTFSRNFKRLFESSNVLLGFRLVLVLAWGESFIWDCWGLIKGLGSSLRQWVSSQR